MTPSPGSYTPSGTEPASPPYLGQPHAGVRPFLAHLRRTGGLRNSPASSTRTRWALSSGASFGCAAGPRRPTGRSPPGRAPRPASPASGGCNPARPATPAGSRGGTGPPARARSGGPPGGRSTGRSGTRTRPAGGPGAWARCSSVRSGLRPGWGLARGPPLPAARWARARALAVTGWTPRGSATALRARPSLARCAAGRRRASRPAGTALVVMPARVGGHPADGQYRLPADQ
jgi:hypothetical protein